MRAVLVCPERGPVLFCPERGACGLVQVKVAAQTAVLVKQLRQAWAGMMADKVARPEGAFTDTQNRILEAIVALVCDDARSQA